MKHAAWLTLLLIPAVGLLVSLADFGPDDARAVAAPPLSLDGYMDEKLPEAPKEKVELKVDNFACYVCHGNYEDDELVIVHGKKKVACIDCHGESYAHRNDEDNITPPDKIFPRSAVDKMCSACHHTHDAPAREVLKLWQERCGAKADPNDIVCTDCHFQHRLKRRTVRWDKNTREVLPREKAQSAGAAGDSTNKGPKPSQQSAKAKPAS